MKVVIVANKPVMNYIMACITLFDGGEIELTLRAREKAISKAVETVQILQRSFFRDLEVSDIRIGSDELREEGKIIHLPFIEIELKRGRP